MESLTALYHFHHPPTASTEVYNCKGQYVFITPGLNTTTTLYCITKVSNTEYASRRDLDALTIGFVFVVRAALRHERGEIAVQLPHHKALYTYITSVIIITSTIITAVTRLVT